MTTTEGANGWLRLESSAELRRDYWLEGFPTLSDADESYEQDRSEGQISPIFAYENRGIGAIQRVNPLYNKAVVLVSDGGWREGGSWHVWFSHGARTLPVGLTDFLRRLLDHRINSGEHTEWSVHKENAIREVESYFAIGIPREDLGHE